MADSFVHPIVHPIVERTRCHWCLNEIVFSFRSAYWWHAQTGTIHCFQNNVLLVTVATPLIGVALRPIGPSAPLVVRGNVNGTRRIVPVKRKADPPQPA